MNIKQTNWFAVDRVLAAAIAEQSSRNSYFCVFDRQSTIGVINSQDYFGTTKRALGGSTGEDNVFHFSTAKTLGTLLTHYPGKGVYNVRFSRTVWADNCGHALFKSESGWLGEGFEALQGEALEIQANSPPFA